MNTRPTSIRKRRQGRLMLTMCVCLCCIVMASGVAEARRDGNTAKSQASTSHQGRNLGELLRPDGSLDLRSGYRGALNPEGYRLAGAPGEEPRFELEAAPGDERWSDAFGLPGFNGAVDCLVMDGSGNLYAGGEFTKAGGVATNYIAKWDGTSWSALGSGMSLVVYSLAVDGSGNLYAGGVFTTAGEVTVNNIAKWDGSAWSALANGLGKIWWREGVLALAVDASGNLYAGGLFRVEGNIAKWDGSEWSSLGGLGDLGSGVYSLAVDANGNLYAGGGFTKAGGVATNHVAKWDGSTWSALGEGVDGTVSALIVDGSGNLYVGGNFMSAGGVPANNIAKRVGKAWSPLGSGMDNSVSALAVDGSGNLYAGGYFSTAGGKPSSHIAKREAATPPFLILGTVKAKGVPLAGVRMTLSGAATQFVMTDAFGLYQFSGLGDGAYNMTPSKNGYGFRPASRTVHIRGDDVVGQNFTGAILPKVGIKATDLKASESGKNKGMLVITRTGATSKPLTVYYKVAGTAKTGVDCRKLPGKLTIPIGKVSVCCYVKPMDDSTKERKETVRVTLVKKPSYQIGKPASATVTIADND